LKEITRTVVITVFDILRNNFIQFPVNNIRKLYVADIEGFLLQAHC